MYDEYLAPHTKIIYLGIIAYDVLYTEISALVAWHCLSCTHNTYQRPNKHYSIWFNFLGNHITPSSWYYCPFWQFYIYTLTDNVLLCLSFQCRCSTHVYVGQCKWTLHLWDLLFHFGHSSFVSIFNTYIHTEQCYTTDNVSTVHIYFHLSCIFYGFFFPIF